MAILAVVCGAVGVMLGVFPKTGFLATILGGAGVVAAFAGEARGRLEGWHAKRLVVVGVALCVVAFALGAYGVFLTAESVPTPPTPGPDLSNLA